MKLYIAGPMTGIPEFNYPAFFAAEKRLVEAGFETLNPARLSPADNPPTWEESLRAAITMLMRADGVALLDGWEKSRGANLEVYNAKALQIPCKCVWEWSISQALQLVERGKP